MRMQIEQWKQKTRIKDSQETRKQDQEDTGKSRKAEKQKNKKAENVRLTFSGAEIRQGYDTYPSKAAAPITETTIIKRIRADIWLPPYE